jgi:hypothetical protein
MLSRVCDWVPKWAVEMFSTQISLLFKTFACDWNCHGTFVNKAFLRPKILGLIRRF